MPIRVIQLTYENAKSGHTYMLSYRPRQARQAIDAIFGWFINVDEFTVEDLRAFLAEVLSEAVEHEMLLPEDRDFVADLAYRVAKSDLGPHLKTKLIRQILKTAIQSRP